MGIFVPDNPKRLCLLRDHQPLGEVGLDRKDDLRDRAPHLGRVFILVPGEILITELRPDHVEVPLLLAIQEILVGKWKGLAQPNSIRVQYGQLQGICLIHPRCPFEDVGKNVGSRTHGFVVSPIGTRLPNSRPVENTKARFPAQPLQSFFAALNVSVFCLQDDSVKDILLSRHKLQWGAGLPVVDRQSDSGRLGWGANILRIGGRPPAGRDEPYPQNENRKNNFALQHGEVCFCLLPRNSRPSYHKRRIVRISFPNAFHGKTFAKDMRCEQALPMALRCVYGRSQASRNESRCIPGKFSLPCGYRSEGDWHASQPGGKKEIGGVSKRTLRHHLRPYSPFRSAPGSLPLIRYANYHASRRPNCSSRGFVCRSLSVAALGNSRPRLSRSPGSSGA